MEILKEYLPDLDFSEDLLKEPKLEEYIKKEWNELAITFNDPFTSDEAPKLDENFGSYFLLCGLPIVNDEKKDKLLAALVNVFAKKGIDYIKQEDITILLGENGESFGTAFIKWEDEKKAKIASATINNFQFGKANLILSTTFDEFERLSKIPEEYVPPKFADLEDLYTYAMDPRNDQFMIRDGQNIVVKLHKVPTKIDKGQKSSDFHTELIGPENGNIIKSTRNPTWSPQGRYLVVLKDNIVQLYGGSNFDLIREIIHSGIAYAQVSPCEKYIITFSESADEKEGNYVFWKIDSGELLRSFAFDELTPKDSKPDVFTFSFDGNYVAKLIKDHVAVYELPGMNLLMDEGAGKRLSIRIDGIKDFKWNPARNMFSYWFNNESKEKQAPKIGFVHIPSREVATEKEIINGLDIKIDWSSDGSKLIATTKLVIKKTYLNNVVLFDVRSKVIPMEIIQIEDNILSIDWNSLNNRLIVLSFKDKKINPEWEIVSKNATAIVYDIKEDKGTLTAAKLGSSGAHIANKVEWSKNGNIFIISDIKNTNPANQGKYYIYYIRNVSSKVELIEETKGGKKKGKAKTEEVKNTLIESINEIEYPKSDMLKWDPTGRYFIIGKFLRGNIFPLIIIGSVNLNNPIGFKIYTAKGEELYAYSSKTLYQFEWRPRPSRNWDEKTQKEFKKQYKSDIRKQIIQLDEKDRLDTYEVFKVQQEMTKQSFFSIFGPLQQRYKDTKQKRKEIGNDTDSEDDETFTQTVIADYY